MSVSSAVAPTLIQNGKSERLSSIGRVGRMSPLNNDGTATKLRLRLQSQLAGVKSAQTLIPRPERGKTSSLPVVSGLRTARAGPSPRRLGQGRALRAPFFCALRHGNYAQTDRHLLDP